jgi:hypothetical protein
MSWLSSQNTSCPSWAQDCQVKPSVAWLQSRLAQVQGVVTLVHSIGLTFLALIATRLAEAAFWPTLARRPHRLESIERHLDAIHGSVPSMFHELVHTKDRFAFATLSCIAVITVSSICNPQRNCNLQKRIQQWWRHWAPHLPDAAQWPHPRTSNICF